MGVSSDSKAFSLGRARPEGGSSRAAGCSEDWNARGSTVTARIVNSTAENIREDSTEEVSGNRVMRPLYVVLVAIIASSLERTGCHVEQECLARKQSKH